MGKRPWWISLIVVAWIVLPVQALAWGATGHQIVGALADRAIARTPAEAQVRRILGSITLSQAAGWADCAKGVDASFVYKDDPRYQECAIFSGEASNFEAYVRNNWDQCGAPKGNQHCHQQYHFADVSTFQDHYGAFVGTSDHDVVHAISAAIAKLQHPEAPAVAPFAFSEREALLVLVHFVGDIHQPLHVDSIYLDAQGHPVDPDQLGDHPGYETAGGNAIKEGSRSLHSDWDDVDTSLLPSGSGWSALQSAATRVAPTTGDLSTWSSQWATDTIGVARSAYRGLSFTQRPDAHATDIDRSHTWTVSGIDSTYRAQEKQIKDQQLAKAGARLAQLLEAIWTPASSPGPVTHASGYLDAKVLQQTATWLPKAPSSGSSAEAADFAAIKQTRDLVRSQTPRAVQAAADDVFDPEPVLGRFAIATGITLTAANAPTLIKLLGGVKIDMQAMLSPVKLDTDKGGRLRPFVEFPNDPSCFSPVDLTGHRDLDLNTYHLATSGSYPSGHAMLGMLVAEILMQALPDKTDALLACGIEFGDSRLICGFHYPSDLTAGRLAAAALFARLMTIEGFRADLAAAVNEIRLVAASH